MLDKKIGLSVDETVDKNGRMVACFIVGDLGSEWNRSFLLNLAELEATNNVTISQFISSSLNLLWPNGVKHENVLLMVTDAACYMKTSDKSLQQSLFPNLIHITCMAHGTQRAFEEIRKLFPKIDFLSQT